MPGGGGVTFLGGGSMPSWRYIHFLCVAVCGWHDKAARMENHV